jgi:GNAT superfamily N-acetyltransferase
MSSKKSLRKEGVAGQAVVRRFEERDREAIRKICSDAALEKPNTQFHEDRELAPLCFTDYYLEYEPESCFVGEVGGRVVGYLVGCTDTRAFNRVFRSRYLPRIVARIGWQLLTLRYRKKETYQMLWWTLMEHFRPGEKLEVPLDEYPAHTHINLVPEYRGCGLSNQLSRAFRQHMRELGITGLHGIIIERAGDNSLFNRFSGRREYRLIATKRHVLLEKMTGKEWQFKLIICDLSKEQEGSQPARRGGR